MSEEIKVGDCVRWTSPAHPDRWAEGTVRGRLSSCQLGSTGFPTAFDVEIERVCPGQPPSNVRVGEELTVACHALERVERPLGAGDYVRYDSPVPTTVPIWAEGEVVGPAKNAEHAAWGWLDVRVTFACAAWQDRVGREHAFGPPAVRRIPCPGAGEQARKPQAGDRVRIARCWKREAVGMAGVLHRVDESRNGELPYQIHLDEPCGTYGEWIWCEQVEVIEGLGSRHKPAPVDPLDIEYDGVSLRDLLVHDERTRREDSAWDEFAYGPLSPAQRAAVSAHWSAQLRERVRASAERARHGVLVELQDIE